MTNAPERIWIEDEFGDGDEDQWTYGTWDVRNYRGYVVEYVRADLALPAVQPDPREAALRDIARQKKTDEMDTEYDVEYAEFEGGYNAIIDVARVALRAVQPDDAAIREAALREALKAVNAKWRSGADTPDEMRGLALAEAAILDLIDKPHA